MRRVILIVLDSVGIGALPDAKVYGDEGSNTLRAAASSPYFNMKNMERLGLFQIEGVRDWYGQQRPMNRMRPAGAFGRLAEQSCGKDTTIGHWELAGLVSKQPLPCFPRGFPEALIRDLEEATGRKVICNRPYSGTEVIRDYGEEHRRTGALIVYTSADSVLQIAAHESVIPLEELYRCCEIARQLCTGVYGVGRVIARPFTGEWPFTRTANRHDYSLVPPSETLLDRIVGAGQEVRAVGKIVDIFAGRGITHWVKSSGNADGIEKTRMWMQESFGGLLFTNLVDYDMLYGHRNDVDGYAKALTAFDERVPELLAVMKEEDILMITADHGCDPSTPSTDHSREYIPLLVCGAGIDPGMDLGTRSSFADIAATIAAYLGLSDIPFGESFLADIVQEI